MRLTTETLARSASKRPWTTVGVWLVVIAFCGFLTSTMLADVLTTDANFTNKPEAVEGMELIEDRLRPDEGFHEIFIFSSDSLTVDDPEFEEAVRSVQSAAVDLGEDKVAAAVTFYDTQDDTMVSADRDTTIMPITLPKSDENVSEHLPTVESLLNKGEDTVLDTQSFGAVSLDDDFSRIAEEDLAKGESFGIVVALVVLIAVFGALVAGLLPIAMAVAAIPIALGITALVGQLWDFSFFVTNMITMMGLAVGIDYSLFIVSRYREERAKGYDKLAAIGAAGATASRAVFFSGLTVVLALLGMLIVPTTIFRSLAAGSIFVVIVSMMASLTLLPALLSLLGDRVNAVRLFRRKVKPDSERKNGFWDKVTHGVMRRPVASLLIGAGLLLLAAFSYLDINTGFAGVSTLPDDARSKQAFEVLSADFSGGLNSPIEIVIDGDIDSPEVQSGIEDLETALGDDPLFGPSQLEVNEAGDLAVLSAPIKADPTSELAVASIAPLREDVVPAAFESSGAEVLVTGDTAFNKDFFDLTDTYTPIVFLFVLGLSFVLLTIVFRSIVVPIKAIVMNLLSVGAAYGLIVLVIQKGVGNEIFGFQQVEAIEAWLPLFLFSVLFGLSMDYHVFLLTRIRERFDQTNDNTGSVAYGLRTTAGLITGAALIMVAVFGGFAAGDLVSLQQMGFGLAVAVLIDATIVRSVLVPASMKLLGERNWYLPSWLSWLPDLHVEGHEPELERSDQAPEKAELSTSTA